MSKFAQNEAVLHLETRGEYYIVEVPERCFIESTGEPAYAYRDGQGILWVRAQSLMEDGRFKSMG